MASQARTNAVISGAAVTNELVAAVTGYKIRVLSYVIDAAGAITAQFLSKSSVTDSYGESNADATVKLFVGDKIRYGQSFTSVYSGLLETARFNISKLGSPTGNVTAKLYAHSGTLGTSSIPTGAALATSDNLDISTLTTSQVLTTLTFTAANRVALVAGTNYCIEILYNEAGSDTNNCLRVSVDTSTPLDDGNSFYYDSGYNAVATNDTPFYVNVSTYLTGAMTMITGNPIVNELQREGIFETKTGEALNLTLSATTQVSGHLTYCLIESS